MHISWNKIPRYLCLCIVSVLMLFPFYWMFITSFKTQQELSIYPPALVPKQSHIGNYLTVIRNSFLGRYYLNSLITAATETAAVLTITIITAYSFYRAHFLKKKVLFTLLMLLHAAPFEVIMVFIFRMMIRWKLNDTLAALMLPFCFNFVYVNLLYNAFTSIPEQIFISARLDGASQCKFLWKIALPYVKPTLIYICIMNTVGCWNSFVWPMMITNSITVRTLPFGLYTYMTETGERTELIMAMSVLSQIPMFLMIVFLRKFFIGAYRSRNS